MSAASPPQLDAAAKSGSGVTLDTATQFCQIDLGQYYAGRDPIRQGRISATIAIGLLLLSTFKPRLGSRRRMSAQTMLWITAGLLTTPIALATRPPLPESILTESATDIDAEAAGELEYEANLTNLRARVGAAQETLASLEIEWRALRQLGFRLEPSVAHLADTPRATGHDSYGLGGAMAVGLLHDFVHDWHLQAEFLGRTSRYETAHVFDPSDTQLPYAADLLSALRIGRWTFRSTVGIEAGGPYARAPLHSDVAILTGIAQEERFGFLVIEGRADWARSAPLVVAPEYVADATALGLPFRLGIALPINVGVSATAVSYGMFMRLVFLTSREAEFGRENHK